MPRSIRFSIAGLLLLTLIAALAASNFVLYRRLQVIEPALEQLRNRVGELTIDDTRLIHAISIPSFEDSTYRWRVHLPPNRRFTLYAGSGLIPQSGLPDSKTARSYISGPVRPPSGSSELTLNVAVNKGNNDRWRLIIADEQSQTTYNLPTEHAEFMNRDAGRTWDVAGRHETESTRRGQPLVLLRLRKAKEIPGGSTVDMSPTDGILVWIAEESASQ